MNNPNLIPISTICAAYEIEQTFVEALDQHGLITLRTEGEQYFIIEDQLYNLEKVIRIQNDLHINFEGVDVILHLLDKLSQMQTEMRKLQAKLKLYEG